MSELKSLIFCTLLFIIVKEFAFEEYNKNTLVYNSTNLSNFDLVTKERKEKFIHKMAQLDETFNNPYGTILSNSDQFKMYIVKEGDTLSDVAKKFYGRSYLWKIVYQDNQEIIKRPHQIYPGMPLIIRSHFS